MNDKLHPALAEHAMEAELQLERERHRKTWRQLEQATGLMQVLLDESDPLKLNCGEPWCRVRAYLTQQAEPAPAQDERETLANALASADWPNVSIGNKALIMRAIDLLTRPAQTEQQPIGRVFTDEERFRSDGKSGPVWWFGPLPAGAMIYAAPIAQTEQPEQRGLVTEAMRAAAVAEYGRHDGDFADFASSVIRAALSTQGSSKP